MRQDRRKAEPWPKPEPAVLDGFRALLPMTSPEVLDALRRMVESLPPGAVWREVLADIETELTARYLAGEPRATGEA